MNVSGSTPPHKSNSTPAPDIGQSNQVVRVQTADAQRAARITEVAKRWDAAQKYLDSLKVLGGTVGAAVTQAAQAALAQALLAAANAQAAAAAQTGGATGSVGSISATGQTGAYLARLNTLTAGYPAVSPRNLLLDLATERSQYTLALAAMGGEGEPIQWDELRKHRLELQPVIQPVSYAAVAERQFTVEMFPKLM